MKFVDLTGRKFNRLTAIERVENKPGYGQARWLFSCDCGKTIETFGYNVLHSKQKSCGCYQADHPSRLDHGFARTKVYTTWAAIRQRCNNPNTNIFNRYGGRGIKVCDRWNESFKNFLADMGIPPSKKHTIERIDNDGDYCPENCAWIDRRLQTRNREVTPRAVFDGKLRPLSEIAELTGVPYKTLHWRFHRGDTGERLVRPVRATSRTGKKI